MLACLPNSKIIEVILSKLLPCNNENIVVIGTTTISKKDSKVATKKSKKNYLNPVTEYKS
jgi:hypothetical protein